jgi:tetratricopeptide (TPR) repeat protein
VALLFAEYARELAKALPSVKAYPLRDSENARRATLFRICVVNLRFFIPNVERSVFTFWYQYILIAISTHCLHFPYEQLPLGFPVQESEGPSFAAHNGALVPLSELKQPQPPQASRPPIPTLLVYAIVGLLIGLVGQEFRWRGSFMTPQNQMAQAEKDVKAGDYKAAVTMFEKLAANNHPLAEYWVAHMTELGLGMPRDPVRAVELYKKAAAQNIAAAQLRLGEIYLHGDLVLPDFAQAKTYLEKAAYHGGPRAAMLLGQMYRDGIGMPADPKEAYSWTRLLSQK